MNRFQAWYNAQPRALRALLTINVVVYVLWLLLLSRIGATAAFVVDHLALHPGLPGVLFEPWQLITYNFLHLGTDFWGLIHILFNMLWLYWIGREHEEMHGPHELTALYVLTGIGGGLLTVALHALFPTASFFGGIVHGASASVLGVMTAVAFRYPYKKIGLIFIGAVRLIYVVIGFLVLDLLFLAGSNTAVGAHFGGVLFGFLYVQIERRGVDLSAWARFFFRDRQRHRTAPAENESFLTRLELWMASRSRDKKEGDREQKSQSRSPMAKIHTMNRAAQEPEPLASEVDRILDKISEYGLDALTEEEKRVLEEASRR